jgi:copper resistance protein B
LLALPAAPASAQRLAYAQDTGIEDSGPRLHYALLDRLEWAPRSGADGYAWDVSALWGGKNGIWLSSVGEGDPWGAPDYLEFQALYSREIGEGYLNAGLRWDATPAPQRLYLTLGGQWEPKVDPKEENELWIGAFGYLSHNGELSARLGGVYNHSLGGGFHAQPSFEVNASAEDVPELGLGRGLTYAEAGLRLRYEVARGLAPYVGVSWERSLGRTARLARAAGEDVGSTGVVVGVRASWASE